MEILKTVLLAVIQALTEFLPLSSSGFVQSVSCLSGFDTVNAEFLSAFLHIPALIIVIVIFKKSIFELGQEFLELFKDLFRGKFRNVQRTENRNSLFCLMISTAVLILFAPLGISGTFKAVKPASLLIINGIGFLVCGFVIFLVHSGLLNVKKSKDISFICALLVGVVQGVSLILPGFSRFGSTVAITTLFGVPKQKAVKYSFIAAVPALVINLVSCFSILQKTTNEISVGALIIGFAVCFIASFLASRLVVLTFNDKGFKAFGYINSVLGIVLTVAGAVLSF